MAVPVPPSQNNANGFLGFRAIETDHKTRKSKGTLTWFYNLGDTTNAVPLTGIAGMVDGGLWDITNIVPQAFINNVDFGVGKAIEMNIQVSTPDTLGIFPRVILLVPTTQQLVTIAFDNVQQTLGATLWRSKHFVIPSNVSIHDALMLCIESLPNPPIALSALTRLTLYNYDVAPVWS